MLRFCGGVCKDFEIAALDIDWFSVPAPTLLSFDPFEQIAMGADAALVYADHFSKGNQAKKNAGSNTIKRPSGDKPPEWGSSVYTMTIATIIGSFAGSIYAETIDGRQVVTDPVAHPLFADNAILAADRIAFMRAALNRCLIHPGEFVWSPATTWTDPADIRMTQAEILIKLQKAWALPTASPLKGGAMGIETADVDRNLALQRAVSLGGLLRTFERIIGKRLEASNPKQLETATIAKSRLKHVSDSAAKMIDCGSPNKLPIDG